MNGQETRLIQIALHSRPRAYWIGFCVAYTQRHTIVSLLLQDTLFGGAWFQKSENSRCARTSSLFRTHRPLASRTCCIAIEPSRWRATEAVQLQMGWSCVRAG